MNLSLNSVFQYMILSEAEEIDYEFHILKFLTFNIRTLMDMLRSSNIIYYAYK